MATQYHNPSLPTNLYSSGAVKFDNRQLNQMLYAEQKQREAQRAAEAKALQDEFANNVSKMRDADVADYTNLYGQYKEMKKALLFDKKLQKDPQAYQKAQMITARTYGELNKLSNASSQLRSTLDDLDKDRLKNHKNYVDDYYPIRSKMNSLPLSQLKQVQTGIDATGKPVYADYSNPEVLIYKGSAYDPTKVLESARGDLVKNEIDEGVTDKTGLQNKITTYQYYANKPEQFKATIMRAMLGDRQAQQYFKRDLYGSLTPEQIASVDKKFSEIPASELKKMGIDKYDLKVDNPNNEADVVATFLAKQNAIENLPRAIKTDLRTNERVRMDMQNAAAMERLRKGHEYRLNEIASKATHTGKEVQTVVNKEIADLLEYAKDNPVPFVDVEGGSSKTGYNLPLTESVITAAQQEKGEPINAVRYVKKDGKDMIYVVKYKPTVQNGVIVGYETSKKNGKPIIDVAQSRYMPLNIFKNQYAKDMFKGKILQGEMGEDVDIEDIDMDGGGVAPSAPQRPSKPVKATKSTNDWRSRAKSAQ